MVFQNDDQKFLSAAPYSGKLLIILLTPSPHPQTNIFLDLQHFLTFLTLSRLVPYLTEYFLCFFKRNILFQKLYELRQPFVN